MTHLLFDLDGTISDNSRGIFNCLRYAFDAYGYPYGDDEELRVFVGPPLFEQIQKYTGADDDTTRKMVEKYRERYRPTGLFENVLYEGIYHTLKALKAAGKKLYLATSKPEPFARRILDHLAIGEFFDEICGANLEKGLGTKEEVIADLFERKPEISRDDCIMIGDTHFDVDGAKHFGIASMGVTYGFGTEQELTASGADIIVHSVTEMQEKLLEI